MYKGPGRLRKKLSFEKPNLVPILDCVFIFIFFLLMSASFIRIFEISSDAPIISEDETKDKPLALTLKVDSDIIIVSIGVPSKTLKTFGKMADGKYDFPELKKFLIEIKKENPKENTAILEPIADITYEEIVQIMDTVRILEKTDQEIYLKDAQGLDVKLKKLFDNIVFANIQS